MRRSAFFTLGGDTPPSPWPADPAITSPRSMREEEVSQGKDTQRQRGQYDRRDVRSVKTRTRAPIVRLCVVTHLRYHSGGRETPEAP